MSSLNIDVKEYTNQLNKGQIQRAYKGIMTFMSELKAYLERAYSDYTASSLYFGYMDMTYFAFTPYNIKSKSLKIAIVFLHETCNFEIWLAANNRKIQAEYIDLLSQLNTGDYSLSKVQPGVDSIVECSLVNRPDFDHPDELKKQIEAKAMVFIKDMTSLLNQC